MTRRLLSPDERATRQDAHLYPKHLRIIDLAVKKHRSENWNASNVVREALELYGRQNLNVELDLDMAVEAERCFEAFKSDHDGKIPFEVEAEKKAELMALDQKLDQAKLELEEKVYCFMKKENRNPEDSRTVEWFKGAWYKDFMEQGCVGSPTEMLLKLVAKGDKEGWGQ
jgi:hypothetical protein